MTKENSDIWEDCHVCGKTILKVALKNHLQDYHSWKAASTSSGGRKSRQRDFDEDYDNLHYELKDPVTPPYDVMDGSKYLGYMQRTPYSKFGSYPIHDDYGDESNPD
jgi:hypothetical protein